MIEGSTHGQQETHGAFASIDCIVGGRIDIIDLALLTRMILTSRHDWETSYLRAVGK